MARCHRRLALILIISPQGPANDYNPSCSPDGTKIAFVSDRYGNPELFMMPANGNPSIKITSNGCVNESPTWSHDGRSLYWVHNCSGNFEIYGADLVYNRLDNQRQLTSTTSDDRFPHVSPDGRSIVFTSYRDGNGEIYLMNIDGSNQRRLTNHPAEDEAATWSADGRQLAFASDRDGNYEIYVMNIDGTGLTRLTNNNAQDRWPLWAQ
jgi:Periplasmic component of the Tol biopolymer transport system